MYVIFLKHIEKPISDPQNLHNRSRHSPTLTAEQHLCILCCYYDISQQYKMLSWQNNAISWNYIAICMTYCHYGAMYGYQNSARALGWTWNKIAESCFFRNGTWTSPQTNSEEAPKSSRWLCLNSQLYKTMLWWHNPNWSARPLPI